ncbi:hypothetical protein BHE74_00030366 [Ensete ventricosum]|nr:hypothetical protein BHE74_00030366 [Ensete ventricosum]
MIPALPLEEEGDGGEEDGGDDLPVSDHDEGAHAIVHRQLRQHIQAGESHLDEDHGQRRGAVTSHAPSLPPMILLFFLRRPSLHTTIQREATGALYDEIDHGAVPDVLQQYPLSNSDSMTSVALLGVDEYAEKSNEQLACLHCLFFHARTGMKEVEDPQWIRSSLTSFD